MTGAELMRYYGITDWNTKRRSRKGNDVVTGSHTIYVDQWEGGPGEAWLTSVWAVIDPTTDKVLGYEVEHDSWGY